MALLGIGGSSSKNKAQATSSGGSIGFGGNIGFGQNFNEAFGGSQGTSFGQTGGGTFVDPQQAGFLDFLRNQGQGAFGGQQAGAQQFGQQLGGLAGQSGQLTGQQNPFLAQLQQQAGGNPDLVAQQTQQLGGDISQFLNETILPSITSQGIGQGTLGGGRGQVSRGIAGGEAARAFSQGALGFQTADAQRAQQAAIQGGGLFQQGIGQGLQGLGQQGQFLGQGFEAQFAPLAQLAQLFGDPTVLSQQFGQQGSQQTAFDQAVGGGFDFSQGFNFDQAFNQSQSTSSGKSKSFNLGFG